MSFTICISTRKARMDCKSPKRISDRLAKSLLEACKRYYFSPENAKGFEEWKKQKDEENRKKRKRYLSESEAQSPKKTASERGEKSLSEAIIIMYRYPKFLILVSRRSTFLR